MADTKITGFTADTAPTSDDLVPTVDTPGGTPANKKATLGNVFLAMKNWFFAADAGSTDSYAATLDPVPASYVTGQAYRFKANTANTGAATINFNSLGAKTIKKAAGGITTDLADNDIRAGQWVDLVYDGTNMQMQSTLGNAGASITPLVIESANTVSQRNSTNAQDFGVYQTYTNASNYSRLRLVTSGLLGIFSEALGSGGLNVLRLGFSSTNYLGIGTVDLDFYPNNTYTIGTNSKPFNIITSHVQASTSLQVNGNKLQKTGGAGVWVMTDSSDAPGTWAGLSSTPTTFSANQDNYVPPHFAYLQRWSSDASRDVTGISKSQVADQKHLIVNVGSQNIVLKHQSANSTAANRFLNSTGADITLSPDQAADIDYDDQTARWRVWKRN